MKTLVTAAACALLASAVYVNEAGAVPVTDGMSREGICNLNDVTTDAYGAANDCYGLVSGNIETSGAKSYETLLAGWDSFAGGGWTVIKEDITFDSDHTWTMEGLYEEVIIVLKQATLWGAWYFNPADDAGTWSTSWVFKGGNTNQSGGLSHGFALGRGQVVSVPEPGMLGLFGLGLLALGLRRRKHA